jgi:hypothetical protein
MSNNRILLPSMILAAATLMTVMFSSCQINDPTKDLKVIVKTIERDNMVSVTLNDVVSKGVVTTDVNILIQGADAGKVTDEVNNKKTSFLVKNGFLSFAIQNGTAISASSPVKLILKITSADYLSVDYPVTITTTGTQAISVSMVKKAQATQAGVEQAAFPAAGNSDNSGKTTAAVAVQTTQGSQVTIPQGTTLKDASGNALTGQINVATTVYYPQAAQLIPQGVQKTNTQSAIPMLSLSVAVTDNSGKVANGVGGNIFVPVDNNFKNPETGASFNPGDVLKMGYVDPTTGQVVYTGESQYYAAYSGSIVQSGKKTTAFSPGWLVTLQSLTQNIPAFASLQAYYISTIKQAEIHMGSTFNTWDFNKAPIELVVDYIGSSYFTGMFTERYNVNDIAFSKSLTITTAASKAYLRIAGNDDIRLSNVVALAAGSNAIEYKAPTDVRVYDILVNGKCPDNNTKEIIPGGTVVSVYNATGTSILSTITLNANGEARLYLEKKTGSYKVRSTYNSKLYEANLTVDANGVPVISGSDVQVIKVDASVSPIVLQYCILTREACN